MKTTDKKIILIAAASMVVGLLAGLLIFGGEGSVKTHDRTSQDNGHQHAKYEIVGETVWTCSMHPQVQQTSRVTARFAGWT